MILSIKLKTSCSFRSIEKSLRIVNFYYNLSSKIPSHVTISNWVKKLGYYQIMKPIEQAKDWIIIVDESIQLGPEKLLVILALRASYIDFNRPLNYNDVDVVTLISKQGWNAEKIRNEIKIAEKKLGKIAYAVSDKGASITKALELCSICQIHDITHKISIIVKKIYKKDAEFTEFNKALASLRLQVQQSKIAHILPPQQRAKCRFMNLKPLSEWGLKALDLLNQERQVKIKDITTNEIISKLEWLSNKEFFIQEMQGIMDVIDKIFSLIKSHGLNKSNVRKCRSFMSTLKTTKGKIFKKEINLYFEEILNMRLPNKKILCTSDIIESAFGKYKMIAGSATASGITDISLCIPAFTSDLNINEIQNILESVGTKNVKQWTAENIGESLLKRRCNVFKIKNRTHKCLSKVA